MEMKFLQRFKNLYALSSLELGEAEKLILTKKDNKLLLNHEEKPRLAQIIKRHNPIEEALEK